MKTDEIAQRLGQVFREVLAMAELRAEGKLSPHRDTDQVNRSAEIFENIYGFACPVGMRVGLILPDIDVRWKLNDEVSGEVQLTNLFSAMGSTIDLRLKDEVIDGHRLGDMRVIDYVVVHAGPQHTLFKVNERGIDEQVYLFDGRNIWPLDLTFERYVQLAAATRGVVWWQYLFCGGGFYQQRESVLDAELTFLEQRFPDPELESLRARWRERHDSARQEEDD